MRVKIFDLSWNVDLNRLENEINAFLATLPSNAVKYVQSAASSTRTGDTDQMQTDYLVTVWYEGEPKNLRPKNQRDGEIQIRTVGSHHCPALIRLDRYPISGHADLEAEVA